MNNISNSLENVFYLADARDSAQFDLILRAVELHGFAIIRGLFDRDEIRAKLEKIRKQLALLPIYPTSGVPPEVIRKNSIKWSVGSQSGSQSGVQRCMLTVYNPMFCDDFLDMRSTFIKLIILRDSLAMREQIYLDDNLQKPKFNATRLQIYPSGGGFMSSHIDSRAIENAIDISSEYIQLVLLLTEKGCDYKVGGAFVEKPNGSIIDSEAGSLSGDVVVYSGNTKHGVADINPHHIFDPKDFSGRIVALATIYN